MSLQMWLKYEFANMVCIFHKLSVTGAQWARQCRQGEPGEEEAAEDEDPLPELLDPAQGHVVGVPRDRLCHHDQWLDLKNVSCIRRML